MYYFLTASADTYVTENQPGHIVSYKNTINKNYGSDEILELKKEFTNEYSETADNVSRIFIKFNYNQLSESINNEEIPKVDDGNSLSSSAFLKLYEIEGQDLFDKEYILDVQSIAGTVGSDNDWKEGTGKHFDNGSYIDGCTWKEYKSGSSWVDGGATDTGSRTEGGGSWYPTSTAFQIFKNQSADINMDITGLVENHLKVAIPNCGYVVKFSGSYENSSPPLNLKFFSRQTNTVYQPKLEIKWNDCSYPNPMAVNLNYLTMSGEVKNHIFIKGLQSSYKESERVRFRLGCRKAYTQKTFTESMLTSSFYIPKGSGSYSIIDSATGEDVVPFDSFTSMSADTTSMYFDQWFNGFETGRYYKVLFKLKYTDGQEIIIDNDEEFKVI